MFSRILNARLTLGLLLNVALLLCALVALMSSDVQAQAPNSGVTIDGRLTMTRSDGPQIRLNDTRFPASGIAATMRGASGGATGMVIFERADGAGNVYVVTQPVGTAAPGDATGFLAYGVGGVGNPCSTNVGMVYYNRTPPAYVLGTSTAGGACSPYAPTIIWSMNHTVKAYERDASGLDIVHQYDPVVFDDANLPSCGASCLALVMSRLVQARADQGGASQPIDWKAPFWDGQGQAMRTIRQQAFCDQGINAPCGVRFIDDLNRALFTLRTDGVRSSGPVFVPTQATPVSPVFGGIQVFTKDNRAGLLSLCAKFPNGQDKCFVMQD